MANSLIRSWFWKIFRLTLLLVLLGGLVDVLMVAARHGAAMFRVEKPSSEPAKKSAIQSAKEILDSPISKYAIPKPPAPQPTPPPVYYSPYEPLITSLDTGNKAIAKETLRLEVSPERIFARYDVDLPKDHPLFEIVQTQYGAESADILVTDVLGPIKLNNTLLKFLPAETSISADEPNAHFSVTSHSVKPTGPYNWVSIAYPYKFNLRIEKREVEFQTKGAQVWSDDRITPYSKTSELTKFPRATNPNSISFSLQFPHGTLIEPEATPTPTPQPTPTPSLGSVLSHSLSLPGLGWLLYGLLGALPFLLFLYWARKYGLEEEQPGFSLKVEAIKIYLAFHFVPYFVIALDDLLWKWGNPAMNALGKFQQRTISVFTLYYWSPEHEKSLLFIVMFVFVLPSIVLRWEQRAENPIGERQRERSGQLLFVVTLIGLLVWAGIWIHRSTNFGFESLSVAGFYSSLLSVLLVGLLGASAWLAFEIFDRRWAGAALLIWFLFVVLLAVKTFGNLTSVRNTSSMWTANGILGVVVFIAAAFMLVFGFARLAYRAISGQSVSEAWKKWSRRTRGWVVLAILLIVISTKFWPETDDTLSTLAFEISDLFLLVLVWILVDFLKYKSKEADWLQLPQSTRRAGILLALATFYSSTARWNYIPVEFLVGLVLLDKWLLPTKRYDKSVFSEIKGQLPRIIQKIIDFNDAEKTLGYLRKELLSKVGKGELTHRQYVQKLKAQSKVVDDHQKELTIQGHFAKQVVLAFGPTESAWENGKNTALYSLFFSAPWMFLFLRDKVRADAVGSYLILDVVSHIAFVLLTWVSYGFIFGYFYPYIKGNNGIQKALSLFLTIVIPTLVWTALASPLDSARWFSSAFWAVQVFSHTMLLGLVAGDYETLRKAGFKWKHLLEIHKASSLSAWASSLLIAIGAAISALIAGGAAQLIGSLFNGAATGR